MEKEIPGFSNYSITRCGIVKTLKRKTRYGEYSYSPYIKSQSVNSNGYFVTKLVSDTGESKLMLIHRLMAIAFIPNPDNYPILNHIDGNKQNNTIENLEWCTHSHNNQHAIDTGLRKAPTVYNGMGFRTGKDNYKSKAIDMLTLDGTYIRTYESARLASKDLGKSQGNISMVCRGERNFAFGYKWRFSQ